MLAEYHIFWQNLLAIGVAYQIPHSHKAIRLQDKYLCKIKYFLITKKAPGSPIIIWNNNSITIPEGIPNWVFSGISISM